MKVTFVLKDFSEQFYEGFGESIKGLMKMSNEEKFHHLKKLGQKLSKMKIGNGAFKDAIELNQLLRVPCNYVFKLSSRRGYNLAEFEITKA